LRGDWGMKNERKKNTQKRAKIPKTN
jgi:hypothetical protein